jgi:hypothetical protein
MITLHCQHRDERGKKCGMTIATIINGVLTLYCQVHNGESHQTPIIFSQLVELAAKEKQRRDQPLRVS